MGSSLVQAPIRSRLNDKQRRYSSYVLRKSICSTRIPCLAGNSGDGRFVVVPRTFFHFGDRERRFRQRDWSLRLLIQVAPPFGSCDHDGPESADRSGIEKFIKRSTSRRVPSSLLLRFPRRLLPRVAPAVGGRYAGKLLLTNRPMQLSDTKCRSYVLQSLLMSSTIACGSACQRSGKGKPSYRHHAQRAPDLTHGCQGFFLGRSPAVADSEAEEAPKQTLDDTQCT